MDQNNENKLEFLVQEHSKEIERHENLIQNLSDKINQQITEMAETRNELKNLCKSVDSLTSILKYFCTTLAGLFVGFFIFMLENHFVIK